MLNNIFQDDYQAKYWAKIEEYTNVQDKLRNVEPGTDEYNELFIKSKVLYAEINLLQHFKETQCRFNEFKDNLKRTIGC